MSGWPRRPARADTHYFDLTEDVEVTRDRARDRRRAPPGLRTAVRARARASSASRRRSSSRHFDELRAVKLRVGALPQHPNNVLKYSLTWSTEGLINEYGNPCQAICDGRADRGRAARGAGGDRDRRHALRGLQHLRRPGLAGRDPRRAHARSMNYKTIRYPGHCEQMRLLMNDLKLNHDRATLKHILENAVPQTLQDVVIVYAAVTGTQDGELREENYVNKVYPQVIAGRLWSAIQVTTAAGITAVVDLVLEQPRAIPGLRRAGAVPSHGDPRQPLRALLRRRAAPRTSPAEVVVAGKTGRQRAQEGRAAHEQPRPERRCSARLGLDAANPGAWSGGRLVERSTEAPTRQRAQSRQRRAARAGARRHAPRTTRRS